MTTNKVSRTLMSLCRFRKVYEHLVHAFQCPVCHAWVVRNHLFCVVRWPSYVFPTGQNTLVNYGRIDNYSDHLPVHCCLYNGGPLSSVAFVPSGRQVLMFDLYAGHFLKRLTENFNHIRCCELNPHTQVGGWILVKHCSLLRPNRPHSPLKSNCTRWTSKTEDRMHNGLRLRK